MGTMPAGLAPTERAPSGLVLELVVPVYNEAHVLDETVRRLRSHLDQELPVPARITIVDNTSTDGTQPGAERLSREVYRFG